MQVEKVTIHTSIPQKHDIIYSHLAFYVNDQAKTKVFRLGCIFSDFRFETIIVLAFTVEVMEDDNLFTRFVTVTF